MPAPVVETNALVRRFGAHTAVDGIDLRVEAGSVYGFLGPNGAGKSTTIRLLLGLLRPDAGTVRLFGRSLAAHRRAVLRRVGALIEAPSLYAHLTGRENLALTRHMHGGAAGGIGAARIGEVLEIVGLAGDADRRAGAYSMGMKQRLGLALALLPAPDLLLLDEPTSGLDPAGMQDVRALVQALPERTGATVFLSSHLLGEVERTATHVGVLRAGRLAFQGTVAALAARRERRVVLGTARPGEAARHLRAAGVEVRPGHADGRLTIPLDDRAAGEGDPAAPQAQAARCTRRLVEAGFAVHHVAVEASSLEDTFLALTRADAPAAPHEDSARAA